MNRLSRPASRAARVRSTSHRAPVRASMGAYPLRSETPTFIGAASRDNAGMTDSGSTAPDLAALADRREPLRRQYVRSEPKRQTHIGGGVPHSALIGAEPERTILYNQ